MRRALDASPEALAEDLLRRPFHEVDEEEKRGVPRRLDKDGDPILMPGLTSIGACGTTW